MYLQNYFDEMALFPAKFVDLTNKSGKLVIVWQNDDVISLSTEDLRRYCACSSCRAKKIVGIPLITTVNDIKHIAPIGNVGIQITFADGHDRGIFPWHYLNAIALGKAEDYLHE